MKRGRDAPNGQPQHQQQWAAAPNPYYPSPSDSGALPQLAPHQGVMLLTSERGASGSVAALRALALASAASASASASARARYFSTAAASALALDAAQCASAASVQLAAAAAARAAAVSSALSEGGGGDAACDAASATLREFGVAAAAGAVDAIVGGGDSGSAPTLPAPSHSLAAYTGRPLRGATSGALYLAAEREAGCSLPLRLRASWKYPLDALAAASAIDPGAVSEAREVLKRPAWPDRAYPFPSSGGGDAMLRAVALASQYDEAAHIDARLTLLEGRANRALTRL